MEVGMHACLLRDLGSWKKGKGVFGGVTEWAFPVIEPSYWGRLRLKKMISVKRCVQALMLSSLITV